MEEQNLIEKTKLKDEQNNFNLITNTNSKNIEINRLSEPFNIYIYYNTEENYINPEIIEKLTIFEKLSKIKENSSECFQNFKYKMNDKKLIYYDKSKFEFEKKEIDLKIQQIEEIKEFITNVNNYSKGREIIYRIIIKDYKEKIDELDIYLGVKNELTKYIFKMKKSNSKEEKEKEKENSFLYLIKQHCNSENIDFYIKNNLKKMKPMKVVVLLFLI